MVDAFKAAMKRRQCLTSDSTADKALSLGRMCPSPLVEMGLDMEAVKKKVDGVVKDNEQSVSSERPPKGTKRKRNRCQAIHCTEVKAVAGKVLPCLFVPKGEKKSKDLCAVALWPQYDVSWKGQDFKQNTWVILGPYEPWVQSVINILTNICQRRISLVVDKARAEIRAAIYKARGSRDAHSQENSEVQDACSWDSDGEDEACSSALKHAAALTVNIGPGLEPYEITHTRCQRRDCAIHSSMVGATVSLGCWNLHGQAK